MAAKLLHSLTDDNIDLQKQIGCMNGIFQLFDRHHTLTGGGRRISGHSSKRLSPGFNGDTMESESGSGRLRSSTSKEKHSHKNIQEKHRTSTESSLSSLSPSSSFSSIDCNRASQLEPASFDSSSPHFSKQSRDLRDLVKDSMYREIHGVSGKADPVARRTTRAENTGASSWYHHNEPASLLRSSSYHAPRFSYDGNRDASKPGLNLKDLPRLSLDSKAGSMRSLHALDSSNARPPSVVAKLMGLTALPDSVSSHDTSSKKSWKEPSSPSWRSPDSPMSRVPLEPAPWKKSEARTPRKPSKRASETTSFTCVYSEIENKWKDLEFTQSGKDLRALKQILETMQSKGFLQVEHRKPRNERALASTKRTVVERTVESQSPIVIMKPAKDLNSSNRKNEPAPKTSRKPRQLVKDENADSGKSSGCISPRLQQKRIELEKRSRPPTVPDSTKSRRQPNKPQVEANSPGGRRRAKQNALENSNGASSCVKASELTLSGSVEKSSIVVSSEEDFGVEHSSPVSVLDDTVSPVKYTRKTIKEDVGRVEPTSPDMFSPDSGSEMNREKLEKIDTLVQKLRRLNSGHDEVRTDYIASLCENNHPDHRYISEILLASGLLLRDLASSLTNFPFHSPGHPINPELFLVLEQTKTTSSGRLHRRLIFDCVNEILARKLVKGGISAQKLLRELCFEIEALQATGGGDEEEDKRWKDILYEDVMRRDCEGWVECGDEVAGAVLDIERSIFKDLVSEIVSGKSTGSKSKQRLFGSS